MVNNILLVTIDSLRTDHVSLYGYEKSHTPTISHLGTVGTIFERAFATGPGTSPSFPAILTGTLPLDYGGLGPLSEDRPRLSRELKKHGLNTGGFQCNLFLSERFNYHIGFDEYRDYQSSLMQFATQIFPRGIEINNPWLEPIDNVLHLTDLIKQTYRTIKGKPRPYVEASVITDDTINWLEATESPFFCWTHYMDVHHPCYPPVEYREQFGVGDVSQSEVSEYYSAFVNDSETVTDQMVEAMTQLYDAAIAYIDDQIGRIIDYLKATERFENTLIIVTSDHGELFGEYGQYGKPERMYDELLHVPLLVANGPAYLDEATDDLISLLDIPSLIHDVLGIPIPDAYQGQHIGSDAHRDHILAEHQVGDEVVVGARGGEWLYEADNIRNEYTAFDLRGGDPMIVSDSASSEIERLRQVVIQRLRTLDVDTYEIGEAVEGEPRDRLKKLGYL